MDRFQQVGPEKGDYAADVRMVSTRLQAGSTVLVALAHRMTRMELVLVLKEHLARFTEPSGMEDVAPWLYVAVTGFGSAWFRVDSYLAPAYVASKLGLERADGDTVAELLTRVGSEMLEVA